MKRFFAGLDLLYHLGTYGTTYYTSAFVYQYTRKNAVDLQNIYVGFNAKLFKKHAVEIYINSRNLVQNSTSDLTGWRRFWQVVERTALQFNYLKIKSS